MAKDFKNAPSPRSEPARLAHPMLIGILIGLLLGIIIALGVALWLNRLSIPFLDKPKPVEPLQRMSPRTEGAPAKPVESPPAPGAPKAGERPRFEFYQILPGEKDAAPGKASVPPAGPGAAAAPASRDGKPAPAAPTAKAPPAAAKAGAVESYFLQAGAYATEADADNMKARIAFVGLEAQVKPVNAADKGTLYRVRLGPYQSLEDANRIKAALSQNGVAAAIIKSSDAN
jgi:cell division protein FtsN